MTDRVYTKAMIVDDWPLYKAMRIRALSLHSNYFLSDEEKAKAYPDERWQEPINHPYKEVFGLFDSNEMIGITGVFQMLDEDPSGETAVMAMSFIEPAYRGKGYSKLLYDARINWAVERPLLKKLKCGHREGNEASRRAMLSKGFELIGTDRIIFGDGSEDTEYIYMLDLEKLRGLG